MRTRLAFAALLAPLAVIALPSHADAQSRGSVGAYSSGATIGGGSYGRNLNSPAITRTAPVVRAPPAIRSSPALPPNNPVATPRHDMNRYYKNSIGRLPPGARATTVKPR